MNLVALVLVAILFLALFFSYDHSNKSIILVFEIAASLILILTGLCFHSKLYLICIFWTIADILLLGSITLLKRTVNLSHLIVSQILLALFWYNIYISLL